jgi:hypothetical protein
MWQADSLTTQASDTTATAAVPVPEPSALALRYYRTSHAIWAGTTALELLVPAALLFTGLSGRVREVARRMARGRWLFTVAIYGAAYVLIQGVDSIPYELVDKQIEIQARPMGQYALIVEGANTTLRVFRIR